MSNEYSIKNFLIAFFNIVNQHALWFKHSSAPIELFFKAGVSSSTSAVIVIDIVAIQNLLAPFCCVFEKEALRNFPNLAVLTSGFKF